MWLLLVTSFVVACVAIASARPVVQRVGLIDRPGGRKTHHGEVPLAGGIGMFVALVAAVGLMPVADPDAAPLLGACALLLAIGLADDRFQLAVRTRLAAHLAAAWLAVMMLDRGLHLSLGHAFGADGTVLTGWAAASMAMLLIGGGINAFNMMDGMDGLAGTLALVPLVSLGWLAAGAEPFVAHVCVAAAGAVGGFLLFNLPVRFNRNWRVFMGDAGSTLLGFLLAALMLRATQDSGLIAPATVLWLVALPVTDLLWTILRRLARGRSPFEPDRGHLHHRLLDAGFGVRASLAVLTLLAVLFAAAGLAMHAAQVPESVQFFGFIGAAAGLAFAFSHLGRVAALLPASWRRVDAPSHQALAPTPDATERAQVFAAERHSARSRQSSQ